MLLRFVVALGAITSLGTGISILFTETCSSVKWGIRGAERAGTFTATCSDVVLEGAMSQFTAAGLAILAGCVHWQSWLFPLFAGALQRRATSQVDLI